MKDMVGNVGILLTLLQWLHSVQADQKATAETISIRDYLEWLRRHNHQELVAALEASHEAQEQLDQLIREKFDALVQMGNRVMETMTSNQQTLLQEFAEVKAALSHILGVVSVSDFEPTPKLSKEAIEILELAVAGDGEIAVFDFQGIKGVRTNPSSQSQRNFEGRYYVEAVHELVNCGFARHSGGHLWVISRPGDQYIASLKGNAK